MKKGQKFIKRYDEAFTMLETLIVLAIVLILTSTVGFTAIRSLEKAKSTGARTQIDSFSVALEAYYIDCGTYPTTEQGLEALYKKPETEPTSDYWNGPYISKNVPKDPWGHEYVYENPGKEGHPYSIISYGADGQESGDGKNADITSWEN
ncbi:MAG: type II secretion system major pseudopilin GspG [Treponema sp.]|uniref:type II secretion system major pseudopilin GspG n=1 Tax=Treponema sp. TaxID=166 RepID=UPI0025D43506|nr:type II secretion system major pseudopilin GspG [Treponema sp.]MBR0100651.1 type II secretion system major pseudopilin GspG [Treponema sp.]MBR0496044.1 type II secretion system major pseudopilin GspG [Treponema sp.]